MRDLFRFRSVELRGPGSYSDSDPYSPVPVVHSLLCTCSRGAPHLSSSFFPLTSSRVLRSKEAYFALASFRSVPAIGSNYWGCQFVVETSGLCLIKRLRQAAFPRVRFQVEVIKRKAEPGPRSLTVCQLCACVAQATVGTGSSRAAQSIAVDAAQQRHARAPSRWAKQPKLSSRRRLNTLYTTFSYTVFNILWTCSTFDIQNVEIVN